MGPLKSTSSETFADKCKLTDSWNTTQTSTAETIISDATLESVECLPVMKELGKMLSLDELNKATDILPTGKAPGLDDIPAEVIKSGKRPLLNHLHELLSQCWEEGEVHTGDL